MDLIVAATGADAAFAAELERAFGGTRLFEAVSTARVADESSLAALIESESKQRAVLVLVVVSRAFVEGVKSVVGLDEVLGTRVDGRRACLVIARSGAAAPPAEAESIWTRRDAMREDAPADEIARRFARRVAAAEERRPRPYRSDSWEKYWLPIHALLHLLDR